MLSIPEKLLFALVVAGSVGYFVRRTLTLVQLVKLGQPVTDDRWSNMGGRLAGMLADVFLQRRVLDKPIAGVLHMGIVWGFFVFAVNTINHFFEAFIEDFHLFGNTIVADLYAVMADTFAVIILAGAVGLAVRRYVFKPESLTPRSIESAIVLAFIGGAMLCYLWVYSTKIALGELDRPQFYIVCALLAKPMAALVPEGALAVVAHIAWWCSAIMHLVLVALLVIPTKHQHLVAGPINILFKRSRPRGQMATMDLEDEEAESFGVSTIQHFTRKQLLDLYACIECGRCQDFCPTYNSQKPLKPKHLIVDLKGHLLRDGPTLLQRGAGETGDEAGAPAVPNLIGDIVEADAIWACTTCGACVHHCPMAIEHVDKITDMRRHLVLMEANFPEQAINTFRNMETAGNPWGLARGERAKWAEGLNVPVMAEKREVDILYWVGCSGSYDERNQRVAKALVRLLNAAAVDFAILGEEERCNCESARRLGNEYLYQTATQEIVETLKQYSFKRILVACPHCLNTLQNEYPDFGGHYEVVHHAQFLAELIEAGRLPLKGDHSATGSIAFHDSCYLGRYNNVYDEPRAILEAADQRLTTVPRQREHGFCCGAGGGRMWLEETLGEPINHLRSKELLDTQPQTIGTSCPFCMTMLTDGVKGMDDAGDDVQVRDIAEILADSLDE